MPNFCHKSKQLTFFTDQQYPNYAFFDGECLSIKPSFVLNIEHKNRINERIFGNKNSKTANPDSLKYSTGKSWDVHSKILTNFSK